MFVIHKTDTGAVAPWEYLPVAAGTYQVGQIIQVDSGTIKSLEVGATGALYLSMADKVCEAGDILPMVRLNKTMILKTTCRDAVTANMGEDVDITLDGMNACMDSANVYMELVAADDKTVGGTVYVRLK